ncbi:alpha-hydroxy-acid oxidizing protein [Bradyrhizobium sp. CSA112]|uniref:alpha-hydroxy acid oxidase n=1 Tax=Bradyrhizobium sp. CSA112 TaxID=2699170 RepID=UPI0023B0CBA3|nr:alpha-hydroxy acid oxidase [Bradyrhizobium sp. CSA112]MDE5458826.1 alpha-hydroxy-acid oxidizing protein [Bradyrhizobium sp. CSA112]
MKADWAYIPGGHTADDLRERAGELLPAGVFAHVIGGAGDERTLAANRAGFGRYRLLSRVLVDVAEVDTSVDILGTRLDAPIFTCPTGGVGAVHPESESGIARGAAAAGVGFMLSGLSSVTLEEVAAAAGPARWQQIFWQPSREVMCDLVERGEKADYKAVVLSVDDGDVARRRIVRTGYRVPVEDTVANLKRYGSTEWQARLRDRLHDPGDDVSLSWKNVEWFKSIVRVPLLLKGIMSPLDARRAVDAGVDGIILSNHGGRHLDGLPGTIEVLEEVLNAVGGKIPVLMDGGVRRATDIAVALSLGAAAVGLGSPVVCALACGGAEVVSAYLEDLVTDLRRALGVLGVPNVAGLTRGHVSRIDQYVPDTVLGPFLPAR